MSVQTSQPNPHCAGQWEISFCFAEKLPGFGLLWSLGSLSAFIAFGHKRAGGGKPLKSLLSELLPHSKSLFWKSGVSLILFLSSPALSDVLRRATSHLTDTVSVTWGAALNPPSCFSFRFISDELSVSTCEKEAAGGSGFTSRLALWNLNLSGRPTSRRWKLLKSSAAFSFLHHSGLEKSTHYSTMRVRSSQLKSLSLSGTSLHLGFFESSNFHFKENNNFIAHSDHYVC